MDTDLKSCTEHKQLCLMFDVQWQGWSSRYSDSLRAGRPWNRIPVKARFSAPVQTVPGAHPTSYTVGTESFPGGKATRAWRWPHTVI